MTPATDLFSPGAIFEFKAQASIGADDSGLGGALATGSIVVNPVGATPIATGAATLEGQQTTSGLIIVPNPSDAAPVSCFKITGILHGSLFQNNGTTVIHNGNFISVAQGGAGLKFTPALDLYNPGTIFQFLVQASVGNSDTGLGGSVVTVNISVDPRLDFGDAPIGSFPTLLADNGARHILRSTAPIVYLGSSPPDWEPDGIPSDNADGDNANGINDENGVFIPPYLSAGLTETFFILASAPGFVNAWIDYDRDGLGTGTDEYILQDWVVAAGANTIYVPITTNATSGKTTARFRITSYNTHQALGVSGLATDGEVEDYAVVINGGPVISDYYVSRGDDPDLIITFADLAPYVTDPEGDSFTLTSVANGSLGNGVVRFGQTIHYYQYDFEDEEWQEDSFRISMTDARGAVGFGTVHITVPPRNSPPTVQPDVIPRLNNTRVAKVLKTTLLSNDSDRDSDPLTLTNVDNPTPDGAIVALQGNFVVYTAPSVSAGNGSFTYTVSDGAGGHTSDGFVVVTETPPYATTGFTAISMILREDSGIVTFIGVPAHSYRLQHAASLDSPILWQEFDPPQIATAPANGVFSFTVPNLVDSTQYFRALVDP